MLITYIPANEYRRERWKNGLGWTREIHRGPGDAEAWDWRVSIAEVEKDGPFSSFEGVERELVLLAGEGMRLHFENGELVDLAPPHGRVRFRGEAAVRAELLSGPTQDFNLMWRRDRVNATLLHRPLVGPMLFFAEADVRWAVHVLSGRAMFKDQAEKVLMERGDTALIEPEGEGGNRVILEGGGELLLARIEAILTPAPPQVHYEAPEST